MHSEDVMGLILEQSTLFGGLPYRRIDVYQYINERFNNVKMADWFAFKYESVDIAPRDAKELYNA